MIRTFWLEQSEADVAPDGTWMSPSDAAFLATLRFPKRRADWRLGRWTAKRAVAAYFGWPRTSDVLSGIEIRATPSGAPEVCGLSDPLSISITHRAGRAICAVTTRPTVVGCDLELVEVRSAAFIEDYFTAEERAAIWGVMPPERFRLAALLWSAKESALKVAGVGLRADTRSASVSIDRPTDGTGGWTPLHVAGGELSPMRGWYCSDGVWVRTVVADLPSFAPQALEILSLQKSNDLVLAARH